MKKVLLLLTFLGSLTFCAMAYDPYLQPVAPVDISQYVHTDCPLCGYSRYFPSHQFIIDRIANLTQGEREYMRNAILDYTGDILRGGFCPFCGGRVPR